jgi:hypothetical protein
MGISSKHTLARMQDTEEDKASKKDVRILSLLELS